MLKSIIVSFIFGCIFTCISASIITKGEFGRSHDFDLLGYRMQSIAQNNH